MNNLVKVFIINKDNFDDLYFARHVFFSGQFAIPFAESRDIQVFTV